MAGSDLEARRKTSGPDSPLDALGRSKHRRGGSAFHRRGCGDLADHGVLFQLRFFRLHYCECFHGGSGALSHGGGHRRFVFRLDLVGAGSHCSLTGNGPRRDDARRSHGAGQPSLVVVFCPVAVSDLHRFVLPGSAGSAGVCSPTNCAHTKSAWR